MLSPVLRLAPHRSPLLFAHPTLAARPALSLPPWTFSAWACVDPQEHISVHLPFPRPPRGVLLMSPAEILQRGALAR